MNLTLFFSATIKWNDHSGTNTPKTPRKAKKYGLPVCASQCWARRTSRSTVEASRRDGSSVSISRQHSPSTTTATQSVYNDGDEKLPELQLYTNASLHLPVCIRRESAQGVTEWATVFYVGKKFIFQQAKNKLGLEQPACVLRRKQERKEKTTCTTTSAWLSVCWCC